MDGEAVHHEQCTNMCMTHLHHCSIPASDHTSSVRNASVATTIHDVFLATDVRGGTLCSCDTGPKACSTCMKLHGVARHGTECDDIEVCHCS